MEFLEVSLGQRLLLIALIFCSALAAFVLVHRHRHQPGWVWRERVPELVLVGVTMVLLTRIFNLMYELQTIQRPSASLLIGARAR